MGGTRGSDAKQHGRPPVSAFSRGWIAVLIIVLPLTGCFSSRSFIAGLAVTPSHPVQSSARYQGLNPFQQDFLYLTETVREAHAEPYAAWSKAAFDSTQATMMDALGRDTTRAAFERCIRSFLGYLHDSHTGAQLSWSLGTKEYPVSFTWLKDTLYLASVWRQEDTALIGSQVLAFNGHATAETAALCASVIIGENMPQIRRAMQYAFVFPETFQDAGLTGADSLTLTLRTRAGATVALVLTAVEKPRRLAPYQQHPVTRAVNKPFLYTILERDSICYMQWNVMMDLRAARRLSWPMNWLAHPVAWYMGIGYFDNFLEDMFDEMEEKGVRTLIVDIRGNGGGSTAYGEQLLYHLDVPARLRTYSMAIRFSSLYREFFPDAYKSYAALYAARYNGATLPDSLIATASFALTDSLEGLYFRNVTDPESNFYVPPDRKVFKGNVFFLAGEGTYSSAIILSTLVKDNRLFPVIGRPTRGRPSHYGETLVLKLPRSGVVARISCKKFFRPDVARDSDDALYPDIEQWPRFEDLLYGRDPEFDRAVQEGRQQGSGRKR
jgi:hypothetical protein